MKIWRYRTKAKNKKSIFVTDAEPLAEAAVRYELFLQWLILAGTLTFALWLTWKMGILNQIFTQDPTRICYVISLFFLGSTVHCGVRALYLAQQLNLIDDMVHTAAKDSQPPQLDGEKVLLSGQQLRPSLPVDYLRSILLRYEGNRLSQDLQLEHTQLTDILSDRSSGQHEIGWFISGLALKLGLLGTVIGFVMMLGTLTSMESLDLSDVQSLLSRMTLGMGVALNTTLAGLAANVLLSFQYLMLDRGADKLVSHTVHYVQTSVIPRLTSGS